MRRYFFHLRDGRSDLDGEGTLLPDAAAVRGEALRLAGGLLQERPEEIWNGEPWSIDVEDDARLPLFSLVLTVQCGSAAASAQPQARTLES